MNSAYTALIWHAQSLSGEKLEWTMLLYSEDEKRRGEAQSFGVEIMTHISEKIIVTRTKTKRGA